MRRPILWILISVTCPAFAIAQEPVGYSPAECPSCASWNTPRPPVRLFGNTYWVGTRGLGAILLTSGEGHVLIDGGLPDSPPLIEENIRRLGFRPEDVEVLLNSHAHYDHAGGIASLQRVTGATVVATAASATAMRSGDLTADDPQRDTALAYPRVPRVEVVADGDTVRVGPLSLVAHLTPGHSPGGTTWSWRSCEGDRCVDIVYADSQTPVSDDGFRFSDGDRATEFEQGLARIEGLACDLLVTPHPGASGLWDRVEAREAGDADALLDPDACRTYAATWRGRLAERLERERAGR